LVQDAVLTGHSTEIVPFQKFTGLNPSHTEWWFATDCHGHNLPTIIS